MCLLSMGLDTLGLLLRVWLWISVPMAVIILLVATWINYLRKIRPKVGLQLAVEGLGGEVLPGGDMLIGRDEVVGAGDPLLVESGEAAGGGEEGAREELTATGKETIYRGILWMKEKYEQYREQADQRYEHLREELGRSERRYLELQAIMEQDKNRILAEHLAEAGDRLAQVQGQLDIKQGIIQDLEAQLRSERLKVEELIKKLQANSELILRIYKELESIPDLGK